MTTRPFQYHSNRQLETLLTLGRTTCRNCGCPIEVTEQVAIHDWALFGEMAIRMNRVQEMLRTSEDYGMTGPETLKFLTNLVQDFRHYKLNGAGDERR